MGQRTEEELAPVMEERAQEIAEAEEEVIVPEDQIEKAAEIVEQKEAKEEKAKEEKAEPTIKEELEQEKVAKEEKAKEEPAYEKATKAEDVKVNKPFTMRGVQRDKNSMQSIGKTKQQAIDALVKREQDLITEDVTGEFVETEDNIPPGYEVDSVIVAESKSVAGTATIREVKTKGGKVRYKIVNEEGRYLDTTDTLEDAETMFGDAGVTRVDRKIVLRKKRSGERRISQKNAKIALFEQEAAHLYEQLREANARKDRIGVIIALKELNALKEVHGLRPGDTDVRLPEDLRRTRGDKPASPGALFELDTVTPIDTPISELTDEQIIEEGEKLGLIFSGFWPDFRWATFVDPDGRSSITVEDHQSVAEALNSHIERKAKARAEAPAMATVDSAAMMETSPDAIRGMYIPTERTAIFFKEAGIQTVIHEFTHHAKSILPIEMQSDLISLFNRTRGRTANGWTVEAEEWFANSMTKWIVNKEQPFDQNDKASMGAFLQARRVVMTAYKDFDLSEETKAGLDELFGDVPDQTAVFGAKLAMDSMIEIDRPTPGQVSALFAGRSGSRFDTKADTITEPAPDDLAGVVYFDASLTNPEENRILTGEERARVNKKLHAILKSHDAVNDLARQVFGDGFTSLTALTDEEMSVLADLAQISKITGDSEMAAQADRDAQQLLDFAQSTFTQRGSARNSSTDSRSAKFLNDLKNKIKNAGTAGTMLISSMESMMKVLDDFNDTGVWHNLVSKPIHAAQQLRAALTKQNNEFFSSLIRSTGLNMRKFSNTWVDLNGEQWKQGQVAFMAVVNRMRDMDRRTFVESNFPDNTEYGYRLLTESDSLAKSSTEMTAFIDATQEAYSHIHKDLSAAYEEVTGNQMGKLDWYMPFVRTNDWDDLDSVMSQLNSVTPEGFEQYKSSTARMKERTGGKGAPIDFSDPFGQTVRYLNQASTYVAMAKTVKSVSTLLATDKAKAALKWKYGSDTDNKFNYRFIHNVLNDLVMGELFHDARIKPMSEGEALFRNWRTRYSMFALAGNVASSMKQVLSAPLGIARSGMPVEVTFRAAGAALSIAPKAMLNAMYNVGNFATGGKGQYKHILAGTPIYELWSNLSPVLLNRHGNPETGEAQNYNFDKFFGLEVSGMPLGEVMMSGITSVDALTVGTLWQATYDAWVRANKADGMSEIDAVNDAASKANSMIRDTQPPSLPQDRNLLQRGNEYTRSFFMFTGATMRQFEVFSTDIMGRSIKALKALKSGGITELSSVLFKGDNLQSGLLMQAGVGFLLPAVLFGLMSRRRKPTEKELMADILSYPFTAMPFAKGLLGAAVGIDDPHGGEASSYVQAAGTEVYDAIHASAKAFHGDGWDNRNIQEAIDGLAFLLSAPRTLGRAVSAGIVQASGQGTFLEEIKAQYVDPYKEATEF
jgi:hypothetical protein